MNKQVLELLYFATINGVKYVFNPEKKRFEFEVKTMINKEVFIQQLGNVNIRNNRPKNEINYFTSDEMIEII